LFPRGQSRGADSPLLGPPAVLESIIGSEACDQLDWDQEYAEEEESVSTRTLAVALAQPLEALLRLVAFRPFDSQQSQTVRAALEIVLPEHNHAITERHKAAWGAIPGKTVRVGGYS
jgi:hypothetical protein